MSARSLCLSAYSVPGTVLVGMRIFSSSDQPFEDHSCFRDGNIKTQTICSGCRNYKAVGWDRAVGWDHHSCRAPNSSNPTLPPRTSWLGTGTRTFPNSLLILAHLGEPHPSCPRTASWSYALKSTSSSGGGWARSRRFIPALPSLLPDLASGESRRTCHLGCCNPCPQLLV